MIYKSNEYKIFALFNILLMFVVTLLTLYPLAYIFSVSISDTSAVVTGKVTFYPIGFNLDAYKLVFTHPNFWSGYYNTVLYTVTGTVTALFMTIICAYPLSKKFLRGRSLVMSLIVFTMFFSGGLVPSYMLIKQIGFINKIWSIIIPGSINVWNMIIMRTFFQNIPEELDEAAKIDGLNYIQILLKIILPLSKPAIATIGLFYAVDYWNDWFRAMIYLNDNDKYPITLFLRNMVIGTELARGPVEEGGNIVAASIKAANIMLVLLPILTVYPFVQKYFVKGVMLGSLKG